MIQTIKEILRRIPVTLGCDGDVLFMPKWFTVHIYHPCSWFWDWGICIPKYKNWERLTIHTPIGQLMITGWLLWGKRPKKEKSDAEN